MSDELKIIEPSSSEIYQQEERAIIDSQIATAKQYPRDIKIALNNSLAIATMDKETAETCNYAIPRSGKTISGPSVHLARMIVQNWGNIRIESKVISSSGGVVISQAVCHDLESNVAVKVEVRRKITNSKGVRFNEDMVVVTGNAASAIAYRNAVFQVVPKAIVNKVYQATKDMITGNLSDEVALIKKRKAMIDGFKDNYKVTEEQILEVLNLNSVNQIKQPEIITLIGLVNAIKDGDTTVADTFGATKKAESKKAAEETNDITNKLKDMAANKKTSPETKKPEPMQLKVKSMAAAKKDLTENFGLLTDGFTDIEVRSIAKDAGIEIIIG